MTTIARIALLWLVLATVTAAAEESPACSWHEEAIPGRVESTRFTLLGTDPDSGAEARRETVLAVDIEYQIAGFTPGAFFPAVLFSTIGQNSVSSHQFDKPYYFEHAAGKAHLCVPLAPLYDTHAVHWPLDAVVMLMQLDGGHSVSVSNTVDIKFQSPDAPMAGIMRNSQRPPREYYDALELATRTFTDREARFEVCLARFPALEEEFAAAHVPWKARHHEDIALAADEQFAEYLEIRGGNADAATEFVQLIAQATRKPFELLPDAELEEVCMQLVAEEVANPDPVDEKIAIQMAIVRRYARAIEAGDP